MKIPFSSGKCKLTSPFGKRTLNGATSTHKGYDLVGVGGTDVVAVVGGVVKSSTMVTDKSNRTWEWGNYIKVRGDDGRDYFYCHLASRSVKAGQTVKAGQKLGVMGNTGYSFGAHLHFEVRQGGASICPESVTGIPNRTGTYEQDIFERDIGTLTDYGIITTADHWWALGQTDPFFKVFVRRTVEALAK